jgi:hypothetical protein
MRFARMLILAGVVAAVLAPAALALRFTDNSYFTPTGIVGQPYTHQFVGEGGCGPGLPHQFRILNGSLPPGLSLSKSGTVSGTPTSAGAWSFWVELSDENPPSASWCSPKTAEREFTIRINANLAITTPSSPPGIVGRGYSLALAADGGGTQTWSLASGQLPPGLALAGNTISGTPTTAGTYPFVVRVSDPTPRSADKSFTLTVRDVLKITAPTSPQSEVGVPFKPLTLAAAGGNQSAYTWSVTGLPADLKFDPATHAIAGTPTAAGSFVVKVTVGDNEGQTATLDVPLTVAARVNITTTRWAQTKVGKPFRGQLKTAGGIGPMKFKVVKGSGKFPVGIRLDPLTGVVSGVPKKAGVYSLEFEVTDALGVTDRQRLVITVLPAKKR